MRTTKLLSLIVVMVFLTGLLATSVSADPPVPEQEKQTVEPQSGISLSAPPADIQNVASSGLQSITPTELPIGTAFDMCFTFLVQSPDAEYGDRVDVDLPDDWTVNSVAANSVPAANGCSMSLPPVSGTDGGNVVFWRSAGTLPTGCGAWNGGSAGVLFNFCANVTIPNTSGAPWSLPWNYIGDYWGSTPHYAWGTFGPVGPVNPLQLTPETYHTTGCPNQEDTYTFTASNSTDSEMTIHLAYAVTAGRGACGGPASLTIPAYGRSAFDVYYADANLVGTSFVCEITAVDAADSANTDTSQINKDVIGCYWDPAGWQPEPIADAIPNQWSAGVVGTHPDAAGPVGYVIGGLREGSGVLNSALQMFDPAAGTWTQLAVIPNPRFSPVAGWIDGLLYAAGGFDASFGSTNDLQVYDPVTGLWDNSTPTDMPVSLGGGAGGVGTCSTASGECLFHVGGSSDSNFSSTTLQTWEYNPAADTWTQLDNKPAGASSDGFILGAGVGCGGKIYVGGDYRGFHDFFVLDPTAPAGSQWSTLASIPAAAGAMTPAMVCHEEEQKIYLLGGDPDGYWGTYNRTVFAYDIASDTWEGPLSQTLIVGQLGSVGWSMAGKLWSVGGTIGSYAISPMPFESLGRVVCVIAYRQYLPLLLK